MEVRLPMRCPPSSSYFAPCAHVTEDSLNAALDALELMHRQRIPVSREKLFSLLQRCLTKSNLLLARRLHALITNTGFASVSVFQDHLIRLFAVCQSLPEANQVFSNVAKPSAHTWYAIISACTKCGEGRMALKMFHKMQQIDVKPGIAMLLVVLKACSMEGSLCDGRLLHNHIVETEVCTDVTLENTLIDMYAKCGNLEDAHKVFTAMVDRDVVSWNALISGYAQHGHGLLPLDLFKQMQSEHIVPCKVTYSCVLKACSNLGVVGIGKHIHEQLIQSGFESDTILGNALIDMYAKCQMLEDAQSVFNSVQNRTVVSWGAIIASYASQGHGLLALKLFDDMLRTGIKPNRVILSCILKACSSVDARCHGMLAHDLIIKLNIELDLVIGNSLVDMYITCGNIEDAHKVFTRLPHRDDVSWNTMIAGYALHGHCPEALQLLQQMQQEGPQPNNRTWTAILAGYSQKGHAKDASQIFQQMSYEGFETNVVTWNALISGFVLHGQSHEALNIFYRMMRDGSEPDRVTYMSVLKACANIVDLPHGKVIHDQIIKDEESSAAVETTLIDMYAKCGSLQEACKVFDKLQHRDAAVWCCMIAGCTELRQDNVALDLFQRMLFEGIKPNDFIFSCTLKACGNTGALEQGRIIHDIILKRDFALDVIVGNTLIDMYTKCGCLKDACGVFDQIDQPDVISWSAMIAAYGESRNGLNSFRLFLVMESRGIHVNEVTFLNLLKGCARIEYLDKIRTIHAHVITRGLTMSGCLENTLVDVYAKCGKLEDANHIFKTLSIRNVVSWSALIMGHAHHEFYKEALMLFHQMQGGGIRPNATTYVGILKVTAGLKSLEVGKCIHFGVSEDGLETELFVGSALVDMYAK
eukprot:c25097_g1_i4 orf=353-2962(+)